MFLISPDIFKIFKSLEPYESRLVGGIVRDYLMDGTLADDIDIATTATPKQVIKMLTQAGMHVIPTGLKHGTVTVIFNNKKYEVTTLRHDTNHTGRHATVAFGESFEEDAHRRDFTFNALYMDKTGKVYDYFNGVNDLKKGVVRFIGNPENRIKEDHLRILRYFRFHTKFSHQPKFDQSTLDIIAHNAKLLQNLSHERITSEILKILPSPHAAMVWDKMCQLGLLSAIGFAQPPQKNFALFIKKYPQTNPLDRLVMLYPPLDFTQTRLRFSNNEKTYLKKLQKALKAINLNEDIASQAYFLGWHACLVALYIKNCSPNLDKNTQAKIQQYIHILKQQKAPVFPLKGQDLLDIGLTSGKAIGQTLKELEKWWATRNFPSKEVCLQQLKKHLKKITY